MTDNIITVRGLQVKLASIETELQEHKLQVEKLEEQKIHFDFVLKNFKEAADQASPVQVVQAPPLFPAYDPNLHATELVMAVLKKEAKAMTSAQVFDVIRQVKPEIKKTSVRTYLYRMGKEEKTPVIALKQGEETFYKYQT